jgi:hypothetical protein
VSALDRLATALADRYRIERELGGGAIELAAESRGIERHFSDTSRAVALATSSGATRGQAMTDPLPRLTAAPSPPTLLGGAQ